LTALPADYRHRWEPRTSCRVEGDRQAAHGIRLDGRSRRAVAAVK
jgi:hypothetical protein